MGDFSININLNGCDKLAEALCKASSARYDAVCKTTAKNIYNRGMSGGTPVDTGELRQSLSIDTDGNSALVGYTKDYAPHVEYGHRTKSGGYISGQHYLQRNVETERPAYKQLLAENLKKVLV